MKTKISKSDTKKSGNFIHSSDSNTGFFSVQAKLNIGEPGDKFEQEADRVADTVVSRQNEAPAFFTPSNPIAIQTKSLAETITPLVQKQAEEEEAAQTKLTIQKQEEEEEMMQMQALEEEEEAVQPKFEVQRQEEEEEEMLQPKSDTRLTNAQNKTETNLRTSRGNGTTMDSSTRAQMENSFGADFGAVKIHTDNAAVQMNKELGARAFTSGNDIYFNQGQYNPMSQNGHKLLAHELTHSIQQGASPKQTNIQKFSLNLSLETQKLLFQSQNYGPLNYTNASSAGSGFEARYNPRSGRYDITVRAKVRFADAIQGSAGSLTSPNIFMNESSFMTKMNGLPAAVVSRILPYYQWNDRQKRIHMIRFRDNLRVVEQMWQGTGMTFQISDSGWEDITAYPRVNINVSEGDAVHDRITGSVGGISFDFTNPTGSDHLQIELVKQVSSAEAAEIANIVNTHDASLAVTGSDARSTRSYMFNDPGSRNSAPAEFNNIMSLESDSVGDTSTRNFDTSVFFEHNESELEGDEVARLERFLNNPMILLDNEGRDVDVILHGFASAPGSSSYNNDLVEGRLLEVEDRINEIAARSDTNANITESFYPINDSDFSAEEDLTFNPESHDPSLYRRVDVEVEREGTESQNVLAHEFGHVFGLGDEYAEVSEPDEHGRRRYNRPTNSEASHHDLATSAGVTGGARVADDNRMMSVGNEIGAAHYATFADALRQLTSKPWRIVT